MRTILSIFLIIACNFFVKGQNPYGDYNPYARNGEVTPSPLWSVEADGTGVVYFEIGNTGTDPLEVYVDQYITLTLTLSYGEPDAIEPTAAVGGTAAELFSWTYYDGTYTGKQVSSIPDGYNGTVTIDYNVKENSAAPGINGFNVNISPAPYQTNSNAQADDAVSYYTYTNDENATPLALNKIGAYQLLIKPNPSNGVFQVDLDSVHGEFILEIVSTTGNIVVQHSMEIDPQIHEITGNFDFLDTGVYTLRIYNHHSIYYGKLMIIK